MQVHFLYTAAGYHTAHTPNLCYEVFLVSLHVCLTILLLNSVQNHLSWHYLEVIIRFRYALLSPQDNAKIDDSEHCSRAELLATHVKRLETLHSTSLVCVQCVHPFLVCNELCVLCEGLYTLSVHKLNSIAIVCVTLQNTESYHALCELVMTFVCFRVCL